MPMGAPDMALLEADLCFAAAPVPPALERRCSEEGLDLLGSSAMMAGGPPVQKLAAAPLAMNACMMPTSAPMAPPKMME